MSQEALNIVLWIVMPMLGVAALLNGWRILRGPTLADRVVGLELVTTTGIAMAACAGLIADQPALLDVSLVLGLVALLATLAYARVLETRP